MKVNEKNPVIITEEDYQLLKQYMTSVQADGNDMSLSSELQRAIIVTKDAFPVHTVRINSKVTVLDLDTDRILEFTIVMPAHADMRQNKVNTYANGSSINRVSESRRGTLEGACGS